MQSVSSNAASISALSHDAVFHNTVDRDIELAPHVARSPNRDGSGLRESHSGGDRVIQIENIGDINPVRIAGSSQNHPRDMTFGAALKNALQKYFDPKFFFITATVGGVLGELVSGSLNTIRESCDDSNRVTVAGSDETVCAISGDIIKSVAKNPNTHLLALQIAGGVTLAMMVIMIPRIINTTVDNLKPEKRWSDDIEIKSLTQEEAEDIKQKILEQHSGESTQSLFDWESLESLLDEKCNIMFIKQNDKYQFCKSENLDRWVQSKGGELINPATNLHYDNANLFRFKPQG